MSWAPLPDPRTPEEHAIDDQKWIDRHYLEDGKAYTFELHNHWDRGYGLDRVESWGVSIKQATCPWMSVAYTSFEFPKYIPGVGTIAKQKAERWAKAYLKRGGPPEGFFDPPPPDPNMVVYKKQ